MKHFWDFTSGTERVLLSVPLQTNKSLRLSCLSHLTRSSGSDQSQREEDFYYTKISCETVDASPAPAPTQQALGQASSSHLSWASCGSPSASGLQIPPAHRPRSNSSSGPGPSRPSPLSQSAPSSFWQIHSEHLYQVGAAVLLSVSRGFGPLTVNAIKHWHRVCAQLNAWWIKKNGLDPNQLLTLWLLFNAINLWNHTHSICPYNCYMRFLHIRLPVFKQR